MSEERIYKRLYRSRKDRVIGGVCGGLGGYLQMDPVIVRLIWLATVLLGGTGVLAYLVAWILIPESPSAEDPGREARSVDGAKVVGIVLIVIALIWIGGRFGFDSMFIVPWGWVGPLALVALGIALLLRPAAQEAADKAEETEEKAEAKAEATEPGVETELPGKKPLRRSRTDRVLFGVCGGIGKHMGIDSTLVRLVFAMLTIFSAGLVIIVYLLLGLVLSEEEIA